MQRLRVAILWHFHQPDYRQGAQAILPWVRLHATKDYAELPTIHREYPSLRITYNLSPILIEQLEDYTSGRLRDEHLDVATVAIRDTFARADQAIRWGFIGHAPRLIEPFSRYRSLWNDARFNQWSRWSEQEWRDLQVWMRLAWFGQTTREQRSVARLITRGGNYTPDDRAVVDIIESELLASVIMRLRGLARAGLAEISCSPYYHPILPLLCDSDVVEESDPDLERIDPPYAWQEDAIEQLQRARSYIKHRLDILPQGIWPSEGSISDAALATICSTGVLWTASDRVLLERSGVCTSQSTCYQPFVWESRRGERLVVFFRDHTLSDAIGFVYSSWDAQAAARDFLDRLGTIYTQILHEEGPAFLERAVVTVILDGENCWEYYDNNGALFLRALYEALTTDERFETVLLSTCAERALSHPDTPIVKHIRAGSWINGSFRIWIGDDEDRTAWRLLRRTRAAFEQLQSTLSDAQREEAYRHILVAQGSDWFWWYGPEHRASFRSVFDELFRSHLRAAWAAMGVEAPGELTQSIMHGDNTGQYSAMHPATAPT